MAGIAIPENVRPTIDAIVKHHFWILAGLVPLLLVPLLVVGAGGIRGRIADQRRQIESKIGQARAVTTQQPHPNEAWQAAIDGDTQAVTAETLEEWRRFWHSQAGLRKWPDDLGKAFLDDVANLKPGGKLDRQSLVRYQNMAPRLARSLPVVMGVKDGMVVEGRDGTLPVEPLPGVGSGALAPPLVWNPLSQKKLYDSFVWQRVPTTTQVLLAQEELWVYGLFCRLIGDFVKSRNATGAHDSPLTLVDELAVGFPANVEPDRDRLQRRIVLPKSATEGSPEAVPGMEGMPPGPEAGPAENPWHPRFSGAGSGRGEMSPVPPAAGDQPAAGSPEDDFRGWIYVDFAGKPLSVAALAAAPDMQLVHLMPFVLRVVIDQRQLDRLLTNLAAAPVPIDVRQVRVNPGFQPAQSAEGGAIPGLQGEPVAGLPGELGGRRPNDIVVELRGSVALAVPPPAAPPPGEATP